MAGLKSITDLPMAENTNGVNLIVNDNGVAKQADLDAVRAEQEYDLVFRMNERPVIGFRNYDLETLESISQEKLTEFWNKVKSGKRVKILLEMFLHSEGNYRWYYHVYQPMNFVASYSDNHTEGYATAFVASEDEGYFTQIIQIVFDENQVLGIHAG